MSFGPADRAKHRREIRLLDHVDPVSRARCDKQPSCPLCHPGWYAARRARHRKGGTLETFGKNRTQNT